MGWNPKDFGKGAHPRPFKDLREDRYAASKYWGKVGVDVSTVNIYQARSLANWNGADLRVPITNQGQLGACAAFSADEAARMAANASGWQMPDDPELCVGLMYELCLMQEGTWGHDVGSNIGDELDKALQGMPLNSDFPYTALLATDYRRVYNTDLHKYIAQHSPFYPSQGNFLQNICAGLDAGHPTVIGGLWPDPFMNPDNWGVLPSMAQVTANEGHAFCIYGRGQVNGRWINVCANHWTEEWNVQAPNMGNYARPGDFAIDDQTLLAMAWEGHLVIGATAPPKPQPQPKPQNHYAPVGDCAPAWQFMLNNPGPGNVQAVLDAGWGEFFHGRNCA